MTDHEYWDSSYSRKECIFPVNVNNGDSFTDEQINDLITAVNLESKRVVEIGGGGSGWLARLALNHPTARFVCVDYSEHGCDLVRKFASENNLSNLTAVQCDFRNPPEDLGKFDLVYSAGVVEHFVDLADALRMKASYLAEDGKMLTWIPNMAGSIGFFTKILNRTIYDIHVPHDLNDFVQGHSDAGLELLKSGYLGSSNYGVLASCFSTSKGAGWHLYKWLSRVSKAGFLIERRAGLLPTSRLFSPYIFAVSARGEAVGHHHIASAP